MLLSKDEIERYARQLILPEFNIQGQQLLKNAKVLIVGAGGLGSPLIYYLAAAGVGNIGIVDYDKVDLSNLQRQILFSHDDIGKSKADCATIKAKNINPLIEVHGINTKISVKNAMQLISKYDVIVDATDNFPTRYLINDACVLSRKPLIYGSIFRFEGQVSVFNLEKNSPCYRCLYPSPPPQGMVPNCTEGGVLGVIAGIIGSLQALETIKIIVDKGASLSGRLFTFDALNFSNAYLETPKDKNCPICSNKSRISSLSEMNYDFYCGLNNADADINIKSISPSKVNERIINNDSIQLIDVREPHETEITSIGGEAISLTEIEQNPKKILQFSSKDKDMIFYCKDGERSAEAIRILEKEFGLENLYNLRGGLDQWKCEVDDDLPLY
jgi:adenylyltransferase/sulfurtransferase